MTDIVPASSGGTVAVPTDDDLLVGMEDFDQSDQVMPTLRIDHTKGVWVDGLSGEEFPVLEAILLGLIKQRVLWPPEVEESSKGPLCRSYDFTVGHPDMQNFPWRATPDFAAPTVGADQVTLACEECPLKDWGSHPKRDTPWCSEQHTFAVLQRVGEDSLAPALLTVQRSAIKPSKTYMTSFARSKTPLFTVWTKIELDHRKRGTVDFAVPKFIRSGDTPQADWPFYAQTYREVREFIQTPRVFDDDSDTPGAAPATPPADPGTAPVPTAAPAAPVAAAAAPAPAAAPSTPAPAPAAAPAATGDDEDDLPF